MLLLLLGFVGLTLIVSKGRIFAPLRAELARSKQLDTQLLAELLSCPMCLGAWTGLALGAALGQGPLEALASMGVVSLLSWFACGVCCNLELLVEWQRARLGRK